MNRDPIFIGDKKAHFETHGVTGKLIRFENESYYKISNSNEMRPFFISMVSDSNHWMFISSNGGLTAGRKNSNNALFPYYTDDKIAESTEITGSKTLVQIHSKGRTYLWEPFSNKYEGIYNIRRNLYKNFHCNKIIFEEINLDFGITFRYQWNTSEQFGFVKKSKLINSTDTPLKVTVLDGIQNVLPYGIEADFQMERSNLADAYKKCELESKVGLGIYALSAIIVDKAEPSEALKSNIVWSTGLEDPVYLLSSLQLDHFRKGEQISQEVDVKAEKGAYFVCAELTLKPGVEKEWLIVADVNKSISVVNQISERISIEENLYEAIDKDIELGTRNLLALNGASDGLQLSADKLRNARHFSNTLFNIMRGGIFDNNYQIEKEDFIKYIANANRKVLKKKEELLEQLPELFTMDFLKELAERREDRNFKRLCFEYMPLKFSRRHGDPSRPWNKFSINTRNENDGSKVLDYEGNWRDIFQNWEALAYSYPEFIESMIHKFVNASTFDGYNPYRVTKDGFDWEVIEEDDPWSYIGYWGDHQIIYLLKFLEFSEDHYPGKLKGYFDDEIFVYANVPYRIKSYQDILVDPKDTIEFDSESDGRIHQKKTELGADGALLRDENFFIYKVNFIEKLLATVLSKVSNFIPEGGIWMNTQRPEWNDANNALVGNGVSMVTLYYLSRFIDFFKKLVSEMNSDEVEISEELAVFFHKIIDTLIAFQHILSGNISDSERRSVVDGLGTAGSEFRTMIYDNGFSSVKSSISKSELLQFFDLSNKYLKHSIDANRRPDGLYHSYNLLTVVGDSEISISYLPEMLEGQVAVLSSGHISAEVSLQVLNALKGSALFRQDQYSYILYPDKNLPRFSDKNNIPSEVVEGSRLLSQLVADGNTQIIEKDVIGNFHFNGNFNNANSLKEALAKLPAEQYQALVEEDSTYVFDAFEDVFDHKSFTGRSGTFFGYEGLGSIYWHMVSKLLLAVQEVCLRAIESNESEEVVGGLLDHYYEINEGIGIHKSPDLYGAFPTDPYSHTPAGKGAQQPGMTGQVKEDILCRIKELGVFVRDGKIQFKPTLLRQEEFLKKEELFRYTNTSGQDQEIGLERGSLCFTYCQIPITYKLSDHEGVEVILQDSKIGFDNLVLSTSLSKKVFERTGEIEQIIVLIKK